MTERSLLLLILSYTLTWAHAQVCQTAACPLDASTPPSICDPAVLNAKSANLPDSIWQSLRRGEPQHLLVSVLAADLADLPRSQQLQAYEIRKQAILNSLPSSGARSLRRLDQLPMMEFEIRSESVLRTLIANCLVSEVYLDREEPALGPKGLR